jgi:hypothetical protein
MMVESGTPSSAFVETLTPAALVAMAFLADDLIALRGALDLGLGF